jgi:PRTRC genetic system protein A
LRCGRVPGEHLAAVLDHFRAALPNEAAAFILWNEATAEFTVHFPQIDEATPTRLVYRSPACEPGWHVVCDMHSHGRGPAYFSATDDADDAHATRFHSSSAGSTIRRVRSWPPGSAPEACSWPCRAAHFREIPHAA